ncbi:MAG: alpha/beta hydrolase [Propionibacteriaceae bacterium]|nr:alpha/beta hydrolase [Propionibacteriaceae bacterium]
MTMAIRGKAASTAEPVPDDQPPPPPEPTPPPPAGWQPDALVEGFESLTLPLETPPLEEEGPDALCVTVVRRADPALRGPRRSVVQVHGWNDYFFHPHVAEFWESLGFTFYAVDLRRYGRSLRPGQLRGFITDLADYAEDLDAALAVVRADHDTIVLTGHSTGGLTASLYAAERPGELAGLVLNSPWLDMWGPPAVTSMLKPLLREWSRRSPTAVFPLPEAEENVYARAMHASHGGEWDYSFDLKTAEAEPIRVGWLRAILQGHARVARGLEITCPVLVTTSARTVWLRRYTDQAREADIVLDVNRINAVAWRLGSVVTTARIEGGTHDLALSPKPARTRWFAEIERWVRAYVPASEASESAGG